MSTAPMLDVNLEIERFPGAPKWRVHLRSLEGRDRTDIDPVTDADLATVPELPANSWQGVISRLRPGQGLDLQHLTQRLFAHLGHGRPLEDAFSRARSAADARDPQWVLPLLFGRPQDLHALLEISRGLPTPKTSDPSRGPGLRSIPPRAPRPFFTGRAEQLAKLQGWLRQPGAAQISGLEGGGGIGKTELACYAAHERLAAGWPVLWVESPERDLRSALATLIAAAQPCFTLTPDLTVEELSRSMRALLAPHRGLLVLDDVSDPRTVQEMLPGGQWNILFTTRTQHFMPGVVPIGLEPLQRGESLELFCKVAFGQPRPPGDEAGAVERLVQRLGGVPLALELSAASLRREGLSCQEYLTQMEQREGAAADAQEEVQGVMLRSLDKLPEADRRVFCALGILPAAGAAAREVAVATNETELQVARRLDRLQRFHLVEVMPESGIYRLHLLLQEAARALAHREVGWWDELHERAATAVESLGAWIMAEHDIHVDLGWLRWRQVREQFDSLDPAGWLAGAPGGAAVAMALVYADQYRRLESPPSERELQLARAVLLLPNDGEFWTRANVLKARGDLRLRRDDLEGASEDYDAALKLFQSVEDRLNQANTLKARGDLRRRREDLEGASKDYDAALKLFQVVEDRLGQANVLLARGNLRQFRDDLEGANEDYDVALKLFQVVENRLGQANVLLARGDLRRRRDDLDGASEDYDAALKLFQVVEDRLDQANVLLARGDLRRRRDDLEGASEDYDVALKLFQAVEDRLGQANALQARGDLEAARNAWRAAERWYLESVALYEATQASMGLASALAELAQVAAKLGQPALAKQRAQQALRLASRGQNRYAEQLAERILATLASRSALALGPIKKVGWALVLLGAIASGYAISTGFALGLAGLVGCALCAWFLRRR